MARQVKDVGASVRARLLNIARERGQPFDVVLTMFVLERLLYRLANSRYSDRFVLKGAMLLSMWLPNFERPTRDVDFLGFGSDSPEGMVETFKEILAVDVDDGVAFDVEAVRVDRIREELEYGGLRIRTTATLSGARIPVVIDVGFGDAVYPGVKEADYPVLLNLPAPRLRTYPRETVIAEKFQAMVALGSVNSRMKDFYDVWLLGQTFSFATESLARAISATFARRKTAIPSERPEALTEDFAKDSAKAAQWRLYVRDLAVSPPELSVVTEEIAEFIMPAVFKASGTIIRQ